MHSFSRVALLMPMSARLLTQVTTYHISTLSLSERSALATSWLEAGTTVSSQRAVQELEDSHDLNSDGGSTVSSDLEETPPDLLETIIVMEYCEKGSLERAVRLGKFKRKEADGSKGLVRDMRRRSGNDVGKHASQPLWPCSGTASVVVKGTCASC